MKTIAVCTAESLKIFITEIYLHIYGCNNQKRILSANVGSHTIVFKSLCFGLFTLKRNSGVFKLKRGL